MNRTRFGKTLKAFSFAAAIFAGTLGAALCGSLFASCENMGGDVSSTALLLPMQSGGAAGSGTTAQALGKGRVTGSISQSPDVAASYAISQPTDSNASDAGISRSVLPDMSDVTITSYDVSAWGTKADGTVVPQSSPIHGTAVVAPTGADFTLELEYGNWFVRADALDSGGNILLSQTQDDVEVNADSPVVSLAFKVSYYQEAGVTGSFALPISLDPSLGIANVIYRMTSADGSVDIGGTYGVTGLSSFILDSTKSGSFATVAPGNCDLVIEFYDALDGLLMRMDQAVQIYSNVTTKKIDGTAPYINTSGGGAAINITSDVIKKYQQSVVYVGGTGLNTGTAASDANNGTQFDPVEHIERALEIINASLLTPAELSDGFKIYVQANTSLTKNVTLSGSKKIFVIGTNQSTPYKIDGATMAYGIETSASDLNFSYINFDGIKSFDVTGGQIKLNNCKITNGVKPIIGSATGGGINVTAAGAKAFLTNCSISGCQACYGGAIYVSADTGGSGTAEVELNNCLIGAESSSPAQSGDGYHSNKANGGGGIYVGGSGRLAFVGTNKISYNYATGSGGGININGDGDNEFAGLEVLNNASGVNGGGIYVAKKLTLDSATISGNVSSGNGGGIYANGSFSTFKLQGGTISSNSADDLGGGVYVGGGATMLMSGDAVIGDKNAPSYATEHAYSNSATNGGGIAVDNASAYIGYTASTSPQDAFEGGIYYNYASAAGGGVYMSDDSASKLYLYKGNVDKNCAIYFGGAAHCGNAGELKISKTVIGSNITAYYGGGISIGDGNPSTAQVTIEDALIQENLAKITDSAEGGAIRAASFDSFALKGGVSIPAGVGGATGAGKNDVWLANGETITIGSTLSAATTPVATITPETYASGTAVLSDAGTGTLVQSEMSKFAVLSQSEDDDWTIGYNSSSKRGVLSTANLYVSNTTGVDDPSHGTQSAPYKTLAYACNQLIAPNCTIYLMTSTTETDNITIPEAAKGLAITTWGVVGQKTVAASGNKSVFGNGNFSATKITFDNYSVRISAAGSDTERTELNDVEIINGYYSMYGGGLNVGVGAVVSATNLKITSCQARSGGGGINVSNTGKFTADGITISGCNAGPSAAANGGGICNYGSVSLRQAKISGCSAVGVGDGIYNGNNGELTLNNETNIDSEIYLADNRNPINVNVYFLLASGAGKIPVGVEMDTSATNHYVEGDVVVTGSVTEAKCKMFEMPGSKYSIEYDGTVDPPCGKLVDKSIAGGVTVNLGGNISFEIATPTASGEKARFNVIDNSSGTPTYVTPTSAQIKILQYGTPVYSANAQEVTATYLAEGQYELYCKAVIGGVTFDTTLPFGAGGKYTPLTLEAEGASTTVTFDNKAAGDVTYRVNGGTAQTIAAGTTETITLNNAGDYVSFYGDNANYATGSTTSADFSNISCNKNCYVYGNIMSLVKSDGFESETALSGENTFVDLFVNNTFIKNKPGVDIVLPATTLTKNCYYSMFFGCTGLTSAPKLPATTLEYQCYSGMFQKCTGLAAAPELPAETLAYGCYEYMFYGCTSLTSAPALPATTLANECYKNMFNGCTSLATAPALPATTLVNECYYAMFHGCTSLATAPALPATTLAEGCYEGMFLGCTSLTAAPELPATTLASWCYQQMFDECTSLATAPALPATTLASWCYYGMFGNCKELTTAPELPATILKYNCYKQMFKGCTKLNSVTCLATDISAEDCTADWLSSVAATGTFTQAPGVVWPTGANGIPAGWVVKGSSAAIPADFKKITAGDFKRAASSGATPYTVTISKDFYMCEHEVTQEEFTAVMGSNPSSFSGSNLPVENVSWYHAIAYCNKRSVADGLTPCYTVSGVSDWGALAFASIPTSDDSDWNAASYNPSADGYRLPTEAEWEYAALGTYKGNANWNGYGSSADASAIVFAGYNGSNSVDSYAWYGDSSGNTHAVKEKTSNSNSLYDMSGNVWEWCWDWNGDYASANVTDPTGASTGSSRVNRGGGWFDVVDCCSVACRADYSPYDRHYSLGFRVVRTVQ